MGSATQLAGGPLLGLYIPPGMTYNATTNSWTIGGALTVTGTSVFSSISFTTLIANSTIHTGTAAVSASARLIQICNSATPFTLSLPSIAAAQGRYFTVKNINTGVVTIDPNGAETIDGAATVALNQWQSVTLTNVGGTDWLIVG